jgi:IMP dehydrogenase
VAIGDRFLLYSAAHMAGGVTPEILSEALTFDDVLLVPAYSEVLPTTVDVATRLTRQISLRIPLVSSAMDTVTEAATAICMARCGGLGIIHRNMTPEEQAREVRRVKRSDSTMITDPITITPEQTLRSALQIMRDHGINGLPVVRYGRPVGILTSRDVRFETNLDQVVGDVMTRNPITVEKGISPEKAKQVLHKHRIEKLLGGRAPHGESCSALITVKDLLQRRVATRNADQGRARAACASARRSVRGCRPR